MSVPTSSVGGQEQRLQRQSARQREAQQATLAAREQGRADFERALARAKAGADEAAPRPANHPAGRPRAVPATAREAGHDGSAPTSGRPQRLAGGAADDAARGSTDRADGVPAAATGPSAATPPAAPSASAAPRAAADDAGAQASDAIEAAAGPAAAASAQVPTWSPAPSFLHHQPAAPSQAFTPEMLGQHLAALQMPEGDAAGRWRFELADASLPVRGLALSRGRDGGLQLALAAAPGADEQGLAPPLQRLRERLAERGARIDGLHLQAADDAAATDAPDA